MDVSDPKTKLSGAEVDRAGLDDWIRIRSSLHARFDTGTFAAGIALTDSIAAAAEEANHHPDLLLTYPSLTVTLTSHDVGGITSRDIALAERISELAAEAGVRADPTSIARVE